MLLRNEKHLRLAWSLACYSSSHKILDNSARVALRHATVLRLAITPKRQLKEARAVDLERLGSRDYVSAPRFESAEAGEQQTAEYLFHPHADQKTTGDRPYWSVSAITLLGSIIAPNMIAYS